MFLHLFIYFVAVNDLNIMTLALPAKLTMINKHSYSILMGTIL